MASSAPQPGSPDPEGAAGPRLRAILSAAVDAIVMIDARGAIEVFSSSAERMFGWTAEEVVGGNVKVLMPSPFHDEHDGYLARYLHTNEARIIGIGREVAATRKDGSVFPVDLSVGEVVGSQGARRFVGIIRDLSDRHQTEALLRQREEELRLTFEHAPTGIALLEFGERLVQVNASFCSIFGRSRDELRDLRVTSLLEGSDRAPFRESLARMKSGDVETVTHRVRFRRSTGEMGQGDLQCGTIHDQSGRPAMAVIQLEDQTERIRSEEEARGHRERLAHVARLSTMGEMATGIAHEINQPLAAIATFARACSRMIESGQGNQAQYLEALDKINQQALRAGDVIHRLRAFVKKRESSRDPCDVNDLVRDVASFAELDTRSGDQAIRLELDPSVPRVSVDPVQIQQVLLNLVRNALEAMRSMDDEPGQVLVVTAMQGEGDVEVRVVDRGSGISADVERELFHPFVTTKSFGLGMGLSISRSIITAHGGELWFTRNEDAGTTFHFTLPAAGHQGGQDG